MVIMELFMVHPGPRIMRIMDVNIYASNYDENANYNVGCEFEQNSNSILYTVNPGGNTLTDYELLFDIPAQDEMSGDYLDVLWDSFNNVCQAM